MPITPTTFRGFPHSDALEAYILTRSRRLESFYSRITECRVLVEFRDRHHEAGNHYHVRIEIAVPGDEIVVSHEPAFRGTVRKLQTSRVTKQMELDRDRRHALVAVREAFEIARRRLQDYARRQRGAVKQVASR